MSDILKQLESINNQLIQKQAEAKAAEQQAEQYKKELMELGWDGKQDLNDFYQAVCSAAEKAEADANEAYQSLLEQVKQLGIEVS